MPAMGIRYRLIKKLFGNSINLRKEKCMEKSQEIFEKLQVLEATRGGSKSDGDLQIRPRTFASLSWS